jgi:L-alanine-DL-glutamate epimerase-like enolase superfamily enzyme
VVQQMAGDAILGRLVAAGADLNQRAEDGKTALHAAVADGCGALVRLLLKHGAAAGVELIEQPLPRGEDSALASLHSPIPICADESCTDRSSLPALQGRYQAVNIKLDKCGGFTEALALAHEAQSLGFELMVGNMCGTSLGMAPAFLVAQLARWVDLDGPLLQVSDRAAAMTFQRGIVQPPERALWG